MARRLDPCGLLLLLEDALCVQDHADEESFSSECKEEVTRDQVRSNRDYRCPLYPVLHFCNVLMLWHL